MEELHLKNEINDNLFLTSVNIRFDQHAQRFKKKKHKKASSKVRLGNFYMYENQNNKGLPKLKHEISIDKKSLKPLASAQSQPFLTIERNLGKTVPKPVGFLDEQRVEIKRRIKEATIRETEEIQLKSNSKPQKWDQLFRIGK